MRVSYFMIYSFAKYANNIYSKPRMPMPKNNAPLKQAELHICICMLGLSIFVSFYDLGIVFCFSY